MNKVKSLGFYQIQGSFKFVEEECVFVFGRQARVHNICIVNTSLHCMWLNIIKRKSKRLLGQKMFINDFFWARHNYKISFRKGIAFERNNFSGWTFSNHSYDIWDWLLSLLYYKIICMLSDVAFRKGLSTLTQQPASVANVLFKNLKSRKYHLHLLCMWTSLSL